MHILSQHLDDQFALIHYNLTTVTKYLDVLLHINLYVSTPVNTFY